MKTPVSSGCAFVMLQQRELMALLHVLPPDLQVDGLPFEEGSFYLRRACEKLALALGDCSPDWL